MEEYLYSDIWFSKLALGIAVALFVLMYKLSRWFAFKVRDAAFHLYLLIMAFLVFPLMCLKGRDVSNLRWCCHTMQLAKWIFGIQGEIRNADNMIRDKPCVIVSNHQSSIDLFGMADLFPPRSSYLVKREFLYYGPVALCFWLSGAVFVDRSSKEDGKRVLRKTAQEVKDRNLKIWIFPEGTRNRVLRGMLPFKKGAFNLAVNAGIPIVPVVFKSYSDFHDPAKYIFKPGTYTIEVLPAVETTGLAENDVTELCDSVRDKMLATYHQLSKSS